MVNRAKILMYIVILVLMPGLCHAEGHDSAGGNNKFLEVIRKPLESIFSPVTGGGFVDIALLPVKMFIDPSMIVVTPARTKEYVYNINKNVSVVTRENIERSNAPCLQDILKRKAGIVLNGYMGNAKDSNVDMRGFGAEGLLNYLVLVDGRRTNQVDMSGADLGQIDLDSIERIEITKGPNTVLYGDNATGGVINIITRKRSEKPSMEFSQKFGGYGSGKEYVSASGSYPFMDYFTSFSYQDGKGYRVNNAYEAADLFLSFTVRPASYMDVIFTSNYHKDWYGQPGSMYLIDIEHNGMRGSRFPDSKAKTEDYYFMLEPRLYGRINEHEVVLSTFMSFRSRRSESRNVSLNVYENDHHITSLDLRPNAQVNSDLYDGRIENKLVLGADYYFTKDRILSGDVTVPESSLFIDKETFGIYAHDSVLMAKRFIFSGGVRGDWAEYVFDQSRPAATRDTMSLKEAVYDAGIGFKYNEKSQVYASYARSFRYPATDQIFQSAYEFYNSWTGAFQVIAASMNTALKPQRGDNYEIGIKDNSFDFLTVNADYYYMDMHNEIYYDPDLYRNMNYSGTVHQGVEIEAKLNVFEEMSFTAGYNFQKAYFKGGKYGGNDIPLVPENKFSAGVDLYPVKGFGITVNMDYIGPRYVINDQANKAPKLKSSLTFDLNFTYKYKNISIFAGVKNILDRRYYLSAVKDWQGNEAFYPAEGRTVAAGFSLKF